VSYVKTTFELPREVYVELKRRAAEEGRTLKEVVLEALLNYLSEPRGRQSRLLDILLKPVEGAYPEDFSEYGGGDID